MERKLFSFILIFIFIFVLQGGLPGVQTTRSHSKPKALDQDQGDDSPVQVPRYSDFAALRTSVWTLQYGLDALMNETFFIKTAFESHVNGSGPAVDLSILQFFIEQLDKRITTLETDEGQKVTNSTGQDIQPDSDSSPEKRNSSTATQDAHQRHIEELVISRQYQETLVKCRQREAENEWIRRFFSSASNTADFKALSPHDLLSILSRDELNVESEAKVYDSIMSWVKFNTTDRQEYLCDLLGRVRLLRLTSSYIDDHVMSSPMIKKCGCCATILSAVKRIRRGDQIAMLPDMHHVPALHKTGPRLHRSREALLVIGSYSDVTKYGPEVELYDPAVGAWRQVASLPVWRTRHGAAVHGNKVYICGGRGGSSLRSDIGVELKSLQVSRKCFRYDPSLNRWDEQVAPMQEPRELFGMVTLGDEIYAVGGGQEDDDTRYPSVEKYSSARNSWTSVASMWVPLRDHSVAALGDQYLYVVGGSGEDGRQAYRYNRVSNTWQQIAPMRQSRKWLSLTAIPADPCGAHQGYLYAMGGWNAEYGQLESVERYNVASGRWESVGGGAGLGAAALQRPLDGASSALLNGREIFLVGGRRDSLDGLNEVQRLILTDDDLATESNSRFARQSSWSPGPRMTVGRSATPVVTIHIPN